MIAIHTLPLEETCERCGDDFKTGGAVGVRHICKFCGAHFCAECFVTTTMHAEPLCPNCNESQTEILKSSDSD